MITEQYIRDKLDALIKERLEHIYVAEAANFFSEEAECDCDCDCDGDEEECDCFDLDIDDPYDGEDLDEAARIVFRVNSKGNKTKKLRCGPGRRVAIIGGKKRCVRVSGKEKFAKKRAIRKANITKRGKGSGYKKRIVFKQKRAIRKRKAMGLKNVKR